MSKTRAFWSICFLFAFSLGVGCGCLAVYHAAQPSDPDDGRKPLRGFGDVVGFSIKCDGRHELALRDSNGVLHRWPIRLLEFRPRYRDHGLGLELEQNTAAIAVEIDDDWLRAFRPGRHRIGENVKE